MDDGPGDPQARLTTEDRAAIEALLGLTPVERFDQLVRTARFVMLGRQAMSTPNGA